jgi:hypothetical protein
MTGGLACFKPLPPESRLKGVVPDQSGYWSITEPEPDPEATGSLDGHMDSGPMQAWLGDPSHDDTYMN